MQDTGPANGEGRHKRQLDALYTISSVLASDSRQRQALAEVLDVLRDHLGMTHGTVMLMSPGGDELLIENISAAVAEADSLAVVNVTRDGSFTCRLTLSRRQRQILAAGGLLNYTRKGGK